jgi:hypothetical protein
VGVVVDCVDLVQFLVEFFNADFQRFIVGEGFLALIFKSESLALYFFQLLVQLLNRYVQQVNLFLLRVNYAPPC